MHLSIYRRVNTQPSGCELSFSNTIDEFLTDGGKQIRVRAQPPGPGMELSICSDGAVVLILVDPFLLKHYAEHRIAPLFCNSRSLVWIVPIWRAYHSGNERSLGDRELRR